MVPFIFLAALAQDSQATADQTPVVLERKFEKGEKLTYRVRADLAIESRELELVTFLPSDEGIEYDFTLEVTGMKADGIVEARYKRPKLKIILGETFNRGSQEVTEKVDQDVQLTISPVNEILNAKDLNPPKKKASALTLSNRAIRTKASALAQDLFGGFIEEVRRLAVFIGPIDTSLDLNPKFPLDEVTVGDSWKKTVGFQPQKLKGTDGKQAVQRLDLNYTYKGLTSRGPKTVQRVEATLKLDTDLSQFLNQLAEVDEEITGIKSFPLRLESTVKFDIDPKTGRTLGAEAVSKGGLELNLTQFPDRPVVEERYKGVTTLTLLKAEKAVAPKPTTKPAAKPTAKPAKKKGNG